MSIYLKNFQRYGLSPSQKKILELVQKSGCRLILELGANGGYMTKQMKDFGAVVDVVDFDAEALKKAYKYARNSYVGSLDDYHFLESIRGQYQLIVAADVLEHLQYPEKLVSYFQKSIKVESQMIISVPNVACWQIRKQLFFKGDFHYQESGVLDKTHLRFFSYQTLLEWLKINGLILEEIYLYEIDYPFRDTVIRLPFLGRILAVFFDDYMSRVYPNLAAGHLVVLAKLK